MRFLLAILLFAVTTGFSAPRGASPDPRIGRNTFFKSTTSERKGDGPRPKVNKTIYSMPEKDSQKIKVLNQKVESAAIRTKFESKELDPNRSKVKNRTVGFRNAPHKFRSHSHFAE